MNTPPSTRSMASLGCRSELFPDLSKGSIYLSAASRTPLPRCVLEAGERAIRLKAATPWDIGDTSRAAGRVKQMFASLISAEASDIALTPSTSYAISLAAQNLRGFLNGTRDQVIVLEDQVRTRNPPSALMPSTPLQMHSSVYPFQQLCTETSSTLLTIRRPEAGRPWTAAVLRAIGPTTAIVVVPP